MSRLLEWRCSASQIRPNPQYNQLDYSPFVPQLLLDLALPFDHKELLSYAERRKNGLSEYSIDWIDRAQRAVWSCTNGIISKETVDELLLFVLNRYQSEYSHIKVLSFAKAFLKYLTKVRLDSRYHLFEVFLERPRSIKARNNVTSRIITKEDIEIVLAHIAHGNKNGLISDYRAKQYKAFILFGAFTGQRSLATMSKLTVG